METNKGFLKTEIDKVVRFGENELAKKILSGEKFELSNAQIRLQKGNLSAVLYGKDMNSIDLGVVKTLNKDTIAIEDIDVK